MKKHFRLMAGIILHPLKKFSELFYRQTENVILAHAADFRSVMKLNERQLTMCSVIMEEGKR